MPRRRLVVLWALSSAFAFSLRGADTPAPCPFCAIVAGRLQQEGIVYRDAQVTAFLSLGARNPGHTLIVPNTHAENFLTTPAETIHHMTDVAKLIMDALKRTDLKAEGFTMQMNTGKAAGQSVLHAHLHIIPRYAGDSPTPPEATMAPERGQTGQAESAPPTQARWRSFLDDRTRTRRSENESGVGRAIRCRRVRFESRHSMATAATGRRELLPSGDARPRRVGAGRAPST